MKIIKETSKEGFKVTVYYWNNKYLIKIEKGLFEQVYKIKELDIASESEVMLFLESDKVWQSVQKIYVEMQDVLDDFLN